MNNKMIIIVEIMNSHDIIIKDINTHYYFVCLI